MSLTIAQKCLRGAMNPGESLAASSRLSVSGLQQKTLATTELGVTVSRHDELIVTCGAEPLTTGNIIRRLAAVHKVPRNTALQTPTNSQSELELDMLRNIQPMQLMCQAAVELVSSADYPSCCIQHTLKTISSGL